jgi:hypothetical protein
MMKKSVLPLVGAMTFSFAALAQPALVVAFCSEGSSHDQYFFRQPSLMMAGAVAPPRLELGNQELVRAYIHSVWLAQTGASLGSSMTDVLDLNAHGFPLQCESPAQRDALRCEAQGPQSRMRSHFLRPVETR